MKNKIKMQIARLILETFNRSCIYRKHKGGGYDINAEKLNWFGHLSNNIMMSTIKNHK